MKFNAYQRFDFKADLYRLEEITDTANGGTMPVLEREIEIDFFGDPESTRSMALTKDVIDGPFMLMNIRDKNGNSFMGNTEWMVTRITPVLNVWGSFEHYKLTLAVSQYSIGPRRG